VVTLTHEHDHAGSGGGRIVAKVLATSVAVTPYPSIVDSEGRVILTLDNTVPVSAAPSTIIVDRLARLSLLRQAAACR
jgi:hypothetical protein